MEDKSPVKTEDQASTLEPKSNASAAKANASNKWYFKLLEETPILEEEDDKLYMQLHNAVFDDVKPQSFLDKIAVKDIADKLFAELRASKL